MHESVDGPVVVVEGLVKDYGEVRAVDGLGFTIEAGEVFALLGPNGAGKTTTVEILEGHRTRTAGSVRVLGMDPQTGGRASGSASSCRRPGSTRSSPSGSW